MNDLKIKFYDQINNNIFQGFDLFGLNNNTKIINKFINKNQNMMNYNQY